MLTLDQFQHQIEEHFSNLAKSRGDQLLPVFALEHGLSRDDLDALFSQLRSEFAHVQLNKRHWLLWVVYSAEQGYVYTGDEYWRSFENRTPHWRENGDREQIRDWYHHFQKLFHGANPSGPWAKQFSIISWPITNAILPQDLQQHLARSVYNARFHLASQRGRSAEDVGRLVNSAAVDPSSRFAFFLQQERLVGQIVTALLQQHSTEETVLDKTALDRIVNDLDRVRVARDWLSDARQVYSATKYKFARGYQRSDHEDSRESDSSAESLHDETFEVEVGQSFHLAPSFISQPTQDKTWKLYIKIPGFQGLANVNRDFGTALRNTRIRIPCTGTTWHPRTWLLAGPHSKAITNWPSNNASLLTFEQSDVILENLLQVDYLFEERAHWIFRIDADGLGRQIQSSRVHAGAKYLLLSRQPFCNSHLLGSVTILCDSIHGALLDLPEHLDRKIETELQKLGITTSRSLIIQPIGIMPRNWNGDGFGEWLTNEEIIFRICADHPVDSYEICLNEGASRRIPANDQVSPIYISLGMLSPGNHVLSVKGHTTGSAPRSACTQKGRVNLLVRSPSMWLPNSISQTGLSVSVSPIDPSIDDFLAGAIELDVAGPHSRFAAIAIFLENSAGETIYNKDIGRFPLPITGASWHSSLHKFLSHLHDFSPFLSAASARLAIDADDLGQFTILLQQQFGPLRWISQVRTHEGDVLLRLVNDTGGSEVIATNISFTDPLWKKTLALSELQTGIAVKPPGGLFIAEAGDQKQAVIISTPRVADGLHGLAVDPRSDVLDACQDKAQLLAMCEAWEFGRLAGPLAEIRKRKVITKLQDRLFTLLCGGRWIRCEQNVRSDPKNMDAWEKLEAAVSSKLTFGIALGKDWRAIVSGDIIEFASRFSVPSARFDICHDSNVCETAIRICLQTTTFGSWAKESLNSQLEVLTTYGSLLRGVRLLMLCRELREMPPAPAITRNGSHA